MASTLEGSGEELVHNLAGHIVVDESAGHDEHVGIVVLTDEVGYLRHPAQARPDRLMLVERHHDALA